MSLPPSFHTGQLTPCAVPDEDGDDDGDDDDDDDGDDGDDGRIIYADHRIATIAGYLPGEVVMITTIRCLHQNVKIDLFFFR